MSDIRKWLKIMESIPAVFPDQGPKHALIKQDATIMVDPSIGGGTARYMHSTPDGAMVDIKGVARELGADQFGLPERDYEDGYKKGNDWFHMSVNPDTPGTTGERPEFRSGDMVKIADVYGSVIGPGFGVFIAYSTSGQECIISFDNKEIVVPTANVGAVLEQNAKNNFDEMDNDGNLSPMSFGSENIKVEEPAMDQKDEFSRWMSAVEEALKTEGAPVQESMPMTNQCGCGAWNCPVCFPEVDAEVVAVDEPHDHNHGTGCPACQGMGCPACDGSELEVIGLVPDADEMDENDDAIAAFKSKGGEITQLPYMGGRKEKNAAGKTMSSSHIGGARGVQGDMPGKGRLPSGNKPIVGEEDNQFVEKPKSGKGVKLGNIVQRTEVIPTDGHESPLSMADHDSMVDEEIPLDANPEDYGKAGRYLQKHFDSSMGEDHNMGWESGGVETGMDPEMQEMMDKIMSIQDMGLSKDNVHYTEDQLMHYSPEEMRACFDRVMGTTTAQADEGYAPGTAPTMPEAVKPTATKHHHHELDDLDDILSPKQAHLPANVEPEDDDTVPADTDSMKLPASSRENTMRKVGAITPTDQMRDFMNRINPDVGADEPAIPDMPQDAVVVRTAADVPAVINTAMQAAGMQNPEWHTVNNLPGYMQRNIRGMGRQLFSMFTSTPLENIQTLANVNGQGPNTDAEMRSVAGWLMNNAEDLGTVDVNHGMAIPGYEPDVKEYRANGIRFQVVRDPMGQYIYAYPDADARLQGPEQGQDQLPGGLGNMPRLRESGENIEYKPTLFEQMKWDEEIDEALIDESSLSKMIGKQKGGQALVQWLHRKHKLSNEAELEPVKFTSELLWSQFKSNPDDFVIVSGDRGVAGIKPSEKYVNDMKARMARKGKDYNPGGDSNLPYQIIAFTDDGQQVDPALLRPKTDDEDGEEEKFSDPTVIKARMGKTIGKDLLNQNNTFQLLNDQIGPIRTVWISGWHGYRGGKSEVEPHSKGSVEREKMGKRADMKKTAPEMDVTNAVNAVFKRVRPVLKTIAHQALSHIHRRAQRYIEGGNFEAAQKVASSGAKLKELLIALDTTNDIRISPGEYGNALSVGITKAIQKLSGGDVRSDEFKKYANEAASGNVAALRPILDALRETFVAL